MANEGSPERVIVIGAGPAGLTAAICLAEAGVRCEVLEADSQVGGISKTVERDGWRFDLGGHRFFTKVVRVKEFWHDHLPQEDFLLRPRMSRIYYKGKFFDYPLRAMNALRNLGLGEAIACMASYGLVRIKPPKDTSTFEGWVASRFGWRLYRTFFKTYTEKVWGVPATEIQADWAAQRIKNLSLLKAVMNSLRPKGRNSTDVTSLIEQFEYPKFGPGMMWEVCADQASEMGQKVRLNTPVVKIERRDDGRLQVEAVDQLLLEGDQVISTMPINELVRILVPPAPPKVVEAAGRIRHRDFLTVALVVPQDFSFPDNWIYIHSPEVNVGRIQNYGSWSPFLIKEGRTCLGLEYFVSEGDELWEMNDGRLIELATRELESLDLVAPGVVEAGYVVRVPKAYPVYDSDYASALDEIREFLAREWPDVHPVGRNGMHRYNNQDHSMLTAMLTVDNMTRGTSFDVWNVNVEQEYHEEGSEESADPRAGTGRSAPTLPK